jgi:hypothetical protein
VDIYCECSMSHRYRSLREPIRRPDWSYLVCVCVSLSMIRCDSNLCPYMWHIAPKYQYSKLCQTVIYIGSGSSVGMATGYGLDGPGIESRW